MQVFTRSEAKRPEVNKKHLPGPMVGRYLLHAVEIIGHRSVMPGFYRIARFLFNEEKSFACWENPNS